MPEKPRTKNDDDMKPESHTKRYDLELSKHFAIVNQ